MRQQQQTEHKAQKEQTEQKVSDQLEAWARHTDSKRTIGGLIDEFGPKSFGILFVILMALPALPLPTGGVSHVLEIVTMLLALELCVGRDEVWLPEWLKKKELKGAAGPKFTNSLLKRIRWFERLSRPRGKRLLEHRLANVALGAAVFASSLTAFLAPPFSGLDTLPALGVVVMGLGMLLGDIVLVAAGLGIGSIGAALVIGLGRAITRLF
jgi:hypothetical protein